MNAAEECHTTISHRRSAVVLPVFQEFYRHLDVTLSLLLKAIHIAEYRKTEVADSYSLTYNHSHKLSTTLLLPNLSCE